MLDIVKITDYMEEKLVNLDLKGKNKDEILKELSQLIGKSENIQEKDIIYKALQEREALGSTGIGKGVAIPHAKTDGAKQLTIAFGICKEGVDFKSLDNEKIKIFFVFASPLSQSQKYLKVLARISRLIREEKFRQKLLNCTNPKDILESIDNEEII